MKMTKRARCALLSASALGFGWTDAALAQKAGSDNSGDIVVTARRVEERLQDVPISITVLNQAQLTNNNIANPKDIAGITPGLQINSRYGSDATNFSIRGFTQEQRTSSTVGVYFADVVMARGGSGTFGGDNATPAQMFDLQNVQVLKGPQGTLQGRNTTGGAVLLVPKRPTDKLEGYVEGSLGDYNMKRVQAVVNVPLSDTFKVRLGVDRQVRDGYLHNIGTLGDGVHPGKGLGDVDYTAERLSIVANLTPDLENYVVATNFNSTNNGVVPKLLSCSQSTAGQNNGVLTQARCQAQLSVEATHSPWTIENRMPDSESANRLWSVADTISWRASDTLTVKNIASYSEMRQVLNQELFGNYYLASGVTSATSGNQVTGFAFTHSNPFTGHTNAQSTFTEELRFQGSAMGSKLNWQGGLYTEISNPLGWSGVQTGTLSACQDINSYNCSSASGFSLGTANLQLSSTKFRDYAIYGQATYALTDKLKLTAGLRYTWDKEIADIRMVSVYPVNTAAASIAGYNPASAPGQLATFLAVRAAANLVAQNGLVAFCQNATAPDFGLTKFGTTAGAAVAKYGGAFFAVSDRNSHCTQHLSNSSQAPTWTIGLDYKPNDDVLLYGKYSRGYRAAGLSLFGPDSVLNGNTGAIGINLQPYNKEKVDTYEVGAKSSWHGVLPGSFNIAGYYNKFSDQQLLLGAIVLGRPNALVANAGKSTLYGIEAELNLRPFDGFKLTVAYSYIHTNIDAFVIPPSLVGSTDIVLTPPLVGHPIPNTQPHKLNIAAEWTLPFVPASAGTITIGANWTYTAKYEAVAPSCPFNQKLATGEATGCGDGTNGLVDSAGAVLNNVNPDGGKIPASNLINANLNWNGFAGSPVDLSLFVTNLTNAVTYVSINDNTSRSFRSGLLGEPRMFGGRVKVKF